MQHKPVTILKDAKSKAVGVMVETMDERFALELHHIDNGNEYIWDSAMKRLKELGKDGINEKQGKLIAVYHEEINAALEEAGGDLLDWEWTVCETATSRAWIYTPGYDFLDAFGYKYFDYRVRPLISNTQIEELLNLAV